MVGGGMEPPACAWLRVHRNSNAISDARNFIVPPSFGILCTDVQPCSWVFPCRHHRTAWCRTVAQPLLQFFRCYLPCRSLPSIPPALLCSLLRFLLGLPHSLSMP